MLALNTILEVMVRSLQAPAGTGLDFLNRYGLQACCDRHELGLGRDILSSIGLGRAMGLMCYARVGLMLETWANWIVDCTVQTVTRCTLTVHSAGSMNVACQNCRPH